MPVHINEHSNFLLLALSKDHLLKVVNLRVMFLTGFFPPSIEVYSRSTKAKVAMTHPIRIDYGHDLKEKSFFEETCRFTVGCEFFEEAFHNEGRYCLSGVHSR